MSGTFENNVAALNTRYPELAARLKEHRPSSRCRLVPVASSEVDLAISEGTTEQLLAAGKNPLETARAYWRQRTLRNPVNMLFLGLDAGHQLMAYLETPSPKTQNYYLVEKDLDLFYCLLHAWDVRDLVRRPNVHWLVGIPETDLFKTMQDLLGQGMQYASITATSVEGNTYSYRHNIPYYKSFLRSLHDATVDLLRIAGNSPHDSFVGVMNMLRNLETIAQEPGVNRLFKKFKGKPAVVVAAGPSLDKNVDLLKEIQDRAIIFSVDASLKYLLGKDIRPHFVTVLERVTFSSKFFADIDPNLCRETVQVSVPVVVPDVYRVYPGPKALLYRPYSHFQWLDNDKGTLMTGASCANMAFKLAVALGCDPIILVGQDLAYGEDGATHSEATPWGRKLAGIMADKESVLRVRGNLSEWVLTNQTWNSFRLAYIKDVAEYSGTVINATEGGAYIEGTKIATLRETIDTHVGPAFLPGPAIAEILRGGKEEDADAYLAWLHSTRMPETTRAICRAIGDGRKILALIERTLAKGAGEVQAGRAVRNTFQFCRTLLESPILYQAVFHVVQPAVVQMMLEHHDLANRHPDKATVRKRRLGLHREFLGDTLEMMERLAELYGNVREAVAEDQYNTNLALLESTYPQLAAKLRQNRPSRTVHRLWDGSASEWKFEEEAEGDTAAPTDIQTKESETHILRVCLGVDISKQFMEELANKTLRGTILIERDIGIFIDFLHVASLVDLGIGDSLWLLIGNINESCILESETIPPAKIITSANDKNITTTHGYSYRTHSNYYMNTLETLMGELSAWNEQVATPAPSPSISHCLQNAELAARSPMATIVEGQHKGCKALVVFPGYPIEAAEELAHYRGDPLVVIAYGSAARDLTAADVRVNYAVPDWSKDHGGWNGATLPKTTTVIAAANTPPYPLVNHPGPVLFAPSPPTFFNWLKGYEVSGVPFLSGCEVLAVWLARLIGGKTIACVGRLTATPTQITARWKQLSIRHMLIQAQASWLEDKADILAYVSSTSTVTPAVHPSPAAEQTRASGDRGGETSSAELVSKMDSLRASIQGKLRLLAELRTEAATSASPDLHPDRCSFFRRFFEPGTTSWAVEWVGWILWWRYAHQWAEARSREGEGDESARKRYEWLISETAQNLRAADRCCTEAIERMQRAAPDREAHP